MGKNKMIGLIAGLVIFLALLALPSPAGLSPEGKRAAAVALLMTVGWVTEAIPIYATAFLPLALYPLLLMIPATFACSFAFMLPSGTGTNTVIFASERVTIPQMARCGLWLNFISIILLNF